jgi:uncharacterized protein (DUF3820 family)
MGQGYEDIALPFGRFKGQLLADISNSYLEWLLDQEFVELKYPKLFQIAKLEQQYRLSNGIEIED